MLKLTAEIDTQLAKTRMWNFTDEIDTPVENTKPHIPVEQKNQKISDKKSVLTKPKKDELLHYEDTFGTFLSGSTCDTDSFLPELKPVLEHSDINKRRNYILQHMDNCEKDIGALTAELKTELNSYKKLGDGDKKLGPKKPKEKIAKQIKKEIKPTKKLVTNGSKFNRKK